MGSMTYLADWNAMRYWRTFQGLSLVSEDYLTCREPFYGERAI